MSSRNKTDVKKIFEFWCEIKNDQPNQATVRSSPKNAGLMLECFPESFNDKKTLSEITTFAFPCEISSTSVESFSFVLTTDDSKWRYGFCRHDPKTSIAMVIITYLPWHDTFLRLLTVLTDLKRSDNDEFSAFLAEIYNGGLPNLGGNLKVFYNFGHSHFIFERPLQFQLPSIPENHNLNLYYNFIDPKNMIAVFAAMLAERRIIFKSRRLDKLSSCIQAANAFLYPMVWQHIFIPMMPMKLKDYLSAPMPYLIGAPQDVLETMTPEELGDVVILDCDTNIFESPFDDVHSLPTEIVSQLKKQLSHSSEHIGDRVSKIFLGVLVQLIGGYRDAVEFRDTGKTFNPDKFIESRPSHLRPFLTKMRDLQIFQQFIDERLEMLNSGLGTSDEFELETVRYAEKLKKRRNFLKNVKEKTNPAVKSAVKSVKEGSRGVKTAYKDLKSKFRDITPPNNAPFRSHLASANSQHDRIDGYVVKSKTSLAGHHSAPSSPVFSKRVGGLHPAGFQYAAPDDINGSAVANNVRRIAPPLAMSSSSAHIQSNGFAGVALAVTHHNNHLASSPTVSPASSICSSDMNLSQELQNHPLFKSPIVDRSLKPSSSLELNHRIKNARRMGASPPARPPLPAASALHTNATTAARCNIMPHSYYNHPYTMQQQKQQSLHPHVETKPPQAPRLQLVAQKHNTTHSADMPSTSTPNKIITTDSIFDNPPDIQSPPVPPRRQCNNSNNNNNNNNNSNAVATAAAAVHAGIHRLERNCWQDYAERSLLQNDALRSSSSSNTSTMSSSGSSASFVSATSNLSHLPLNDSRNKDVTTPVPAPRLKKEKESLRSLQPQHMQFAGGSLQSVPPLNAHEEDTMNDLISLDDSNNASFDLEDLDPLNPNARPLPGVGGGSSSSKRSTTLPAGASSAQMSTSSISNPLYPYFAPPQAKPPPLPTSKPPRMPPPDEDFELLRKYGLDQFTLTADAKVTATTRNGTLLTTSANALSNGAAAVPTASMCNWTTFD